MTICVHHTAADRHFVYSCLTGGDCVTKHDEGERQQELSALEEYGQSDDEENSMKRKEQGVGV